MRTLLAAALALVAQTALITCLANAQKEASQSSAHINAETKPLLLEKEEGELWIRRPRPVQTPASQMLLKVSPGINGSQHLVVGTETVPVGGTVPIHKHLAQDEMLLINDGVVHVTLGDQNRDLHAGGLVFVPANTWVGLKNISSEVVGITFIFSSPGFDDYVKCTSVQPGEKAPPLTPEDWRYCQKEAQVLFKP